MRSPSTEAEIPELRRRLASVGVELEVETTEVPPEEHGTIQSVQWPNDIEPADDPPTDRMRVPEGAGGTVVVTVGRGDPSLRVPVEFERAIRTDDPRVLEARLRRLGHEVEWRLIVFHPDRAARDEPRTSSESVDEPPPGTCVISVLDEDGSRIFGQPPKTIQVEIASPQSAAALKHPC